MGNLINQYREESDPRDGIELPDIRYVAQAAPPTAENNFNNEFNWEDQGVTFPTTAREAIDNINEEREAVGLPTSETAGADDPSPNFDRPTPVAEEPIETTDVPFTPVQVGNAPREFNPQEEAANISNNVYGTIGEAQLDGAVLPIYYPSSGSDDIIRASKNFNNTVFDRSRNLGKEIVNIIQPQQPLYIPPGMAKKLQQVSPTESATPFQGHNRETLDGMGSGTNSVNVFLNAYSTWFGGGSERSGYVFDTNEPEENRTARSFAPFAGLRRAFEKFKTDPGGAITGLVPMLFNPFSANSLSFRGSQWGDYPGGLLGGLTYAVDLDENPLLGGMTDLIYKIQGRKTDADGLNIVQAARGRDYNFSAVRRVNADGTVENPLSVFAGEHTKEPTTIGELRNRSWLWRLVVPFGLSDDIKIKTPDNLVGSLEFGTGVVLDMGASLLTGGLLDGGLEGIEKWKQSRNVREVTPAFTPAHVPPEPKPIGISTVVDSRGATAEIPAVTDLSNYKGTPIAPDNQYAPKVTDSGTIVRSPLTDIGTDVKTPQIVNPGSILNDNPVPKVADLPEDVDLAGKVGAQANRTSELVAKLDEEAEATAKVLDEVETIPDVGRQVDFSIEPLPDNFRPLAKVENEAAEPQLVIKPDATDAEKLKVYADYLGVEVVERPGKDSSYNAATGTLYVKDINSLSTNKHELVHALQHLLDQEYKARGTDVYKSLRESGAAIPINITKEQALKIIKRHPTNRIWTELEAYTMTLETGNIDEIFETVVKARNGQPTNAVQPEWLEEMVADEIIKRSNIPDETVKRVETLMIEKLGSPANKTTDFLKMKLARQLGLTLDLSDINSWNALIKKLEGMKPTKVDYPAEPESLFKFPEHRDVHYQQAPIRVYHGTVVNNPAIHTEDVFNGAARSELGVGMHLTTNKPVAELYADAPAQINLPAVTTRPYKESGTVHEYVVDPSILKIVNSTDALDPAIKTRMIGRMQAFGINEEEVFKAVRESNDYTELFEKTTMAQYPFNEANALNIQRLLTAEIMDSGVDGLKHGDGQYVIYRPNYLIHSGAEPMLDANLSALGKKISRMNADAHALSQFPNSTLAKRNYAESRLSVFQQKAYETRKVAQEANEELETLSTDLARMFNDAKPKKDVEVPETVNGKGGKATKESVSNKDAVRTVAKSDVAQRLERLHALHEATSKKQKTVRGTVEAAQAKVAAIIDVKNVMYASKTQALNPSKFNAFESFLAAQFNMKRKALDTALGLTEAGAVRVNLREAGTIAQGIVDDLVRLRMSAAIKGLSKRIYELIPEDRASRQAANRLRLDIIEIGSIPKLQATYGMMPGARRFNAERYKKLVDTLKGLGISNKEIQELIQLSTEISTKMDEMRLVGNALGLDIGKEEMLGYLTRVMTPELSKWIDVTEAKGFSSLTDLSAKGGGGHGGVIEGSRVSSHLVPEDLTILSNKTGFTESELKEMLSDGSLTRALMDTLPDEKLNKLVDTHVLSKVSMTTNELSDFIIAKYGDKLPMQVSKGTLPVFIDDPELITDYYVKYLKDQTYKSNVAKRIVSDGLNNGWVFPKAKFDSLDAAAKENFVKLDAATVRRYYPTYKETADLYVHKTVDQQWRSMMAMINDPLTMNTLHQNIKSFGGFFNQAILTNPTYPARILYDSFRSFYAAGGNLLRFHEGWRDIATIMRKESIDHLNNTDAIYRGVGGKLVTEQELFRQFIALFGTDYAPLTTATKLNKRGHFKNILNLPRGVAYATEMVKKIGVMEGGKEFLSLAKGVQEDLFAELATVATFFETSSKWALIKSWMSDSKFNKITQNVTQLGVPAPNPKTLQDAALVIEDYFTAWNDVGTGSRLINDTVRPFAVYAIWNSPAQIRQILRRPHEFENYIRIQSFLNRDFNQEDKHVEWTLPQFIKDNRPVALWKDKNGNWVTVLPTSWDSRADFFASGERTVTQVYKDAGIITGNAPEQYKQILNEEKDLPLFGDYIKEAAPYIKTFVSLVTGRDALSGKEIKGELETGSRTGLPWQAEYLLSTYPPFDAMMRTNPFELLGTPEFRDPKTLEVIIPGRPGLLGNRRVDYDPSKYQNTWGAVNILRRIGLNIKIIDTARNLQYNYSKAERAYNLLKSDIGSLQKELTLMDMKGERETYTLEWQQKQKQFETKVYQLMYMQKDLMVMQEYMKYRNVKPTEVIKFIDQETLRQVQERVGDKLIIELMDEIQQYNKYLSTGEK